MLQRVAQQYGNITSMLVTLDKHNKSYNFIASAFACGTAGYFLTSAHTIKPHDNLGIMISREINTFQTTKAESLEGFAVTLVGFDPINDVALLKANEKLDFNMPSPSAFLGDETAIKVGTSIGYLGYPYGSQGLETVKISSSIISSKILTSNGTRALQLDSSVNDGNSGGPLIDIASGKIIGIITGRYSPSGPTPVAFIGGVPLGQDSNISYAVGISYAVDLMKDEGIYV
ncbi:S1 family peptidase [Pseudomonas sp. CFBP 13719]|uniref:S1 family peptidase n=1 Tax=Pseudomonas sp. CFBP 13719 TaxID=2775303 RepID=UPI001781FB6A|nr:serine protease [Pseudomonas sp. CFBP 13719]MBD8682801.1 trypsin-like peptidase domain-containing protein [Pseudomonas sp. CFBP 13719]